MADTQVEASQRPEYLNFDAVEDAVAPYRGTILAEDFSIKSARAVMEVMERLAEKKKEQRAPEARLRRFEAKTELRDRVGAAAMRDAGFLRHRLKERPVLRGVVRAEARIPGMEHATKVVDREFHEGRLRFRHRKAQVRKLSSTLDKWEPKAKHDRQQLKKLTAQTGKMQRFTTDQRRARTLVALRDSRLRAVLLAKLPYLEQVEDDLERLEVIADEILGSRARLLLEGVGSQLIVLEASGKLETAEIAAGLEPTLGRSKDQQRETSRGLHRSL